MSLAAQRDDAQSGRHDAKAAEADVVDSQSNDVIAGDAVHVDPAAKRVVVFRLGSLGDTVVALPSFHLIARAFPNAERRLLTNVPVVSRAPAAAAVLGESGLIHSYESYPVGTRNPVALLQLVLRLRRFRPDVAVYLKAETDEGLRERDRRFLRLGGAKRVVGFQPPSDAVARQMPDGTREPEVQRLLRSIAELGTVNAGARGVWDMLLTEPERARADLARAPLRQTPFFAASIGTKVQSKDWGEQHWSDLLEEVAVRYPGHGLLLAGAAEERASSARIAEVWRTAPGAGSVVNTCGDLSPRETAAAFCGARAFLGHDSGPMHLAAAVGAPVVAVFAARNLPQTWFPYGNRSRVLYHAVDCAGCGLEVCVEQRKKCLLSITTGEVLNALQALVEGAQ